MSDNLRKHEVDNVICVQGFAHAWRKGHNLTLKKAICELIDNSIDANATIIKIYYDHEYFIIHDDGNGVDDLRIINKLYASSKKNENDKIGKWGIGYWAACVFIGDFHYFISKGRKTITKSNELKQYDEDTANEIPSEVIQKLGEKYNARDTYVCIKSLKQHKINSEELKKWISHSYGYVINKTIEISINDEKVNASPYIENNIKKSIYSTYIVRQNTEFENRFDIEATTETDSNLGIIIKNPVTYRMYTNEACINKCGKCQAKLYKKNINDIICTFQFEYNDNNLDNNGLVVNMGSRTLQKRFIDQPHNCSTATDLPIFKRTKIVVSGNRNIFRTNVNKGDVSQESHEVYINSYLYSIQIYLMNEFKNKVKKQQSVSSTLETNKIKHPKVIKEKINSKVNLKTKMPSSTPTLKTSSQKSQQSLPTSISNENASSLREKNKTNGNVHQQKNTVVVQKHIKNSIDTDLQLEQINKYIQYVNGLKQKNILQLKDEHIAIYNKINSVLQ
jgi:hypothetical protein